MCLSDGGANVPGMQMSRYLTLIQRDEQRLAAAAEGNLAARVPSCPDWTVQDLVEHVGHVYLHKVECMRQQRSPEPWPPPAHGRDPLEWLGEQTAVLLEELAERGPAAPSYTWHEPDQSVGFWYRRMAQETAVHRVDAELAAGAHTPVDPELALDGVDELLDIIFAGDWSDLPQADLIGRVALRAGARAWLVVLEPDQVRIEPEIDGAEATVNADPSDLLLWLWRRLPTGAVTVEGDRDAADRLYRRLAHATE